MTAITACFLHFWEMLINESALFFFLTQNTFSKNGKNTIVVRQPGIDIGQRRALSVGDIVQTRLLYKCPSQLYFRIHYNL